MLPSDRDAIVIIDPHRDADRFGCGAEPCEYGVERWTSGVVEGDELGRHDPWTHGDRFRISVIRVRDVEGGVLDADLEPLLSELLRPIAGRVRFQGEGFVPLRRQTAFGGWTPRDPARSHPVSGTADPTVEPSRGSHGDASAGDDRIVEERFGDLAQHRFPKVGSRHHDDLVGQPQAGSCTRAKNIVGQLKCSGSGSERRRGPARSDGLLSPVHIAGSS